MSNPYAVLKETAQLPTIDKKNQEKMGKSMQRRISIHYTDDSTIRGLTGQAPALPNIDLEQYGVSSQPGAGVSTAPMAKGGSLDSAGRKDSGMKTGVHRDIMNLRDPQVLKMLSDPQFNAEQFISARLADATASDIEKFNTQLRSLNINVQNDVKATALQTFEKLGEVSDNLETTSTEVKHLRNSINDLMDITVQMKESAEHTVQLEMDLQNELTKTNSKRKKRARDRSSILVLEKMWASEMNSLFRHVEGAQKYISAIPGRHIIAESGRWQELNAATFKTLQPAHIFLLNDLILIATRKRKVQKQPLDDKQQLLVASQCWPLREAHLTELKLQNSSKDTYAINIKYNSLSYVYQTDRLDHYTKVLEGYKKARNELRDISEAENMKQKQLRDSMNLLALSDTGNGTHPTRNSLSRNSQIMLQDLSTRMHSRSRSLDNSNVLRMLKSLDGRVDDVDVQIFHEDYQGSVTALDDIIIELEALSTSCTQDEKVLYNVIELKVCAKKDKILKMLIKGLRLLFLSFSRIEKLIKALLALKQTQLAETLFLNNRSSFIELLLDRVPFEKNINGEPKTQDYIVSLSIVKFQSIKTTIEQYKKLFANDYQSQSYLVSWGVEESEKHIVLLKRIIQNVKITETQLRDAIVSIHGQVESLKEEGLDVEYLLDEFYKTIDTV